MTPAEQDAHYALRAELEAYLAGYAPEVEAFVAGSAERYAEAMAAADPAATAGDLAGAVAVAVARTAAEVMAEVRTDRDTAVSAAFPAVAAYLGAAVGTEVAVTWSDTADTDPPEVLGVAAVQVDGDAFAWVDASGDGWPELLAARLRADLAGEVAAV